MRLSELTASLGKKLSPADDIDIRGLAYDSRRVKPGYLFVAVPGEKVDGHDYIGQSVNAGAAAVITQKVAPSAGVTQVLVDDARLALALVSARYYDFPSKKLKLIGITGTNGKTTTAYLLESIFRSAGLKTGLIGTIEYRLDGRRFTAERTTPEALDLQHMLASMVDKGVEAAVMEVSSHALKLKRVDGCSFAGRLFTNLSQDHLDFHHDLEDYFLAKARLFTEARFGKGVRIVNIGDTYGRRIADIESGKITTYGMDSGDYYPADINLSFQGISFSHVGPKTRLAIRSRLIGAFNLINIVAAATIALEIGLPEQAIIEGILGVDCVPGRFENIVCGQNFQVLVDYAHTPDGLEKVLSTAKLLAGDYRLITVFGCGGDRDRAKRPLMGAIAGALSDLAIVTSDNPRTELPEAIIEEIVAGISEEDKAKVSVVVERSEAIKAALSEARFGDVVVIAGKGHESYQILDDRVIPFDDCRVAGEALRELIDDTC